MCTFARFSFMGCKFNPTDHFEAEYAWDWEEGADGLMLLNIFPAHLGLAVRERLTFHECVSASKLMLSINDFGISEDFVATILRVDALKLQVLQFSEELFLDWDKLRAFAHHGTRSGFPAELI